MEGAMKAMDLEKVGQPAHATFVVYGTDRGYG